ncbi:unnamed protein product, partial [marine sediment metagenome]
MGGRPVKTCPLCGEKIKAQPGVTLRTVAREHYAVTHLHEATLGNEERWRKFYDSLPFPKGSSSTKQLKGGHHSKAIVICPICGKEIEIPEYDRVTRSEALRKHIEKEHSHHSTTSEQGKVHFIGGCKVVNGLCHRHGYSVSKTVRCPKSPLTDEEWGAAYELVKEAFPEGQSNPWVNGWWPETMEEAERVAKAYELKMGEA